MADAQVEHLIVGGGVAGASCAVALREAGAEGAIVLLGRELDAPYARPPASKGYLRGDATREDALLHPAESWAQRGIDLRTRTSAMKLDPAARTVTLSTKDTVEYEHLLLATGANVRRLRLDGGALQGIHYLRALGNADAIRGDAREAKRVVLVGGSYIACEVAASLTELGVACTLVMEEAAPLSRHFGERAGAFFAGVLEAHGVTLECGDAVDGFVAGAADPERVGGVRLASGRVVEGDLVVMGTGAMPDVMLARAAGLALGETGGIACDAGLRASAPGIWAAGDVCEYASELHGRALRVEHFEHAKAQGEHVARAMLGDPASYAAVPYFWSDLADWVTLESVGPVHGWDRLVERGSIEDGAFSLLYLGGDRLVGALCVGRSEDVAGATALVGATLTPSREAALADVARPLAA